MSPPAWVSVRTRGGRVEVLDTSATGAAVPLLAAHGLGGTGLEFAPLAAEMGQGFRLVAPDFPGTGRSDALPSRLYSMEHFVSVLRDVLDALALARVVLVGHSLGGKVAVRFAVAHPESVLALVLVAPYGLAGQEGRVRGALAAHRRLTRMATALHNRLVVRWELRRRVYYDRSRIPAGLEEHLVESQLSPGGRAALAAVASSMIGIDPIDSLLPAVLQPTLILWGREDRVLPSEAAARYAALMPSARLVLLDRCGHVPTAERPAESARAVEVFLRNLGLSPLPPAAAGGAPP